MLLEELIRKFRSNSLSLAELEEMRRQLSELPPSVVEDAMTAVYEADGVPDDEMEVAAMLERVRQRIDREIGYADRHETVAAVSHGDEEGNLSSVRGWKFFSMAAMLIAIMAVGLSFYFVSREDRLLASTGFTEVATGFGEKSSITLPDGTVVRMSGRTRLRYPSDIALGNRRGDFEGEAYFDVRKDSDHPFKVSTGTLTVEVTGTSFNLYSRLQSDTDELILDQGSVTLYAGDGGETVTLKAGESAVYNKVSGGFDVVDFKDNPSIRRRVFGVRYDNIEPAELVRILEKTYDVTISSDIAAAINSPFTGVLPDDDLNEVLAILSKIYGFKTPYSKE